MFMGKLDNMKKKISYFIKKNIFIVLVLIGLCPVLAISYAKFTINSESYRSNEMYISELLYSIKIDGENKYSVDIEPGETEHIIEITSLNAVSTNYKLAYLNNNYIDVKYASDYLEPSFGGIVTTRKISLTIKNTSNEKQTLSLMVFGGYSFNNLEDVKVLDSYTEILDDYWKYDYETTAIYIDNVRTDKLDSNKNYSLVNYSCSNGASVSYDSLTRQILIKSDVLTKCSLYFKENPLLTLYLMNNYSTLGLTKIEQLATGNQNYNTTEYRYQGASPNNYVTFNDETGKWRIIGVFEVETPNRDGTYTRENKVKIVRENIGTNPWNNILSGSNYNDWTTAVLMSLLNSGTYYNKTGEYSTNGLTDSAKNQISSTKWYLGGTKWNDGYGNTKEVYIQERSTDVYSGNVQIWNGKVALIYPSDYMYASSGCYNNGTGGRNYSNSLCTTTNWMLNAIGGGWFLSPLSGAGEVTDILYSSGEMNINASYNSSYFSPSLYLASNVEYMSGSGSITDPFIIK